MKLISYTFTFIFFYIITQATYAQIINYDIEIGFTTYFNTERPTSQNGVLYLDSSRKKSFFIYGKNTESSLKQNEEESTKYDVFLAGKKKVFNKILKKIRSFQE